MGIDLIDTHCHLPAIAQAPIAEILQRAANIGVRRCVCIGASEGVKSAEDAVSLAQSYPNVWASIGIHPHDAKSFIELSGIEKLAAHPKVVAIGETGLDFFRDWAPRERQLELFDASVQFALNVKKPLIIHSRAAGEETFAALRKWGAAQVGGVFHCYGEDAEFAKRLEEINFIVSFPGSITFKSASALRETVKAIPLNRMMLETDAPYMAPEPYRGKPSEPAHVLQIAMKLAEIKDVSLEEVSRVTTHTGEQFFGIPSSG